MKRVPVIAPPRRRTGTSDPQADYEALGYVGSGKLGADAPKGAQTGARKAAAAAALMVKRKRH